MKRINKKKHLSEERFCVPSWDSSMELIQNLLTDGHSRLALFVGCGCYLGLSSENLLQVKWADLLTNKPFILSDSKTRKVIDLHVCKELVNLASICYRDLGEPDKATICFVGQDGMVLGKNDLRKAFAQIVGKYSTHNMVFTPDCFRVVYGRHIMKLYESRGEMALLVLSQMFNHPNPGYTKHYLGI